MTMPPSQLESETGLRNTPDRDEEPVLREQDPLDQRKRPSTRRIAGLLFAVFVLTSAAFVAGWLPRAKTHAEAHAIAAAESVRLPVVTVLPAERASAVGELTLPVTIQALTEAPVLARADGYLKQRCVDIGDRVKTGQLLGEIEAPEVDQQVQQAKATVLQYQAMVEQARAAEDQAKVQQQLARVTAERFGGLLSKGAVSRQDNDQYQTQFLAQTTNVLALNRAWAAAQQNLAAAEANLARLTQVQSYKQVRAPFDGVITLRNTEVGALISSGQTLLFRVAQTDRLRAYINVPQSEAESIRAGEIAEIRIPEFEGRSFEGKVVRTANAFDPASRTLLAEVQLPNPNGLLMPGVYGQVVLHHRVANPLVLIPGGTLMIGTEGAQVATVDSNHRVRIRRVSVGRDYGRKVEISSGLSEGDLCIINPNDDVREGAEVEIARQDSEHASAGQSGR